MATFIMGEQNRTNHLTTNRDIMPVQIFRPFGGNLVSFVEKTTVVAESLKWNGN